MRSKEDMADAAYDEFLRGTAPTTAPLLGIYHAVRRIPYGSVGERDPLQVMRSRCGSCSGKHILLRDLLRKSGYEAEIITMFTHFESKVPPLASFPPELKALIREGGIRDFHHYVRARRDGEPWIKLDATWHDALAPYPLPVNHRWNGEGDTQLASVPLEEYPAVEDLIPYKMRLVASLPPVERERRARFFDLLTGWMARLPDGSR